ncbi:MAG: hypothetical protein NWE98_02430 [Candidatus Bathyarchaeota archaeon]|nr:hypothetical protein [Candidatus Bathyarchaeota archaeon]
MVELAIANPVFWPSTPITDKPTIVIERPTNNTAYNDTAVYVSLTVTLPDSWKREDLITIPSYYTRVDSVNAYLDGKSITLAENYTDFIKHNWIKNQSYFCVLNQTAPGQHMLNLTVASLSYYRGPAYNGSHIPSDWISSSGTVYQYPMVVFEEVYFTIEQPTLENQDINVQPAILEPANLIILPITILAIVLVVSVLLHRSRNLSSQ